MDSQEKPYKIHGLALEKRISAQPLQQDTLKAKAFGHTQTVCLESVPGMSGLQRSIA